MSTEEHDHDSGDDLAEPREPGPAMLSSILDDLRESDVTVPIDPSYQTSSTDAEAVNTRAIVPNASVTVRRETADELDLDPRVLAYLTVGDQNSVTLNIEAHGPEDRMEAGSVVDLTPNAARAVAIQLLASAAVADRDTDGPEGYLTE